METIPALVGAAHFGLAIAAAALTVGVTAVAAVSIVARPVRRGIVDQLITLVVAAVGTALLLGLPLLLTRGLADPLHALYAAVALVALPAARIFGVPESPEAPTGRSDKALFVDARLGRWLVVAGVVTLGVLLRLAMTG